MKIFIRPGHGGTDPGAQGNGLVEKTVNLNVALKLKELLEYNGFEVKIARDKDVTLSLEDGVAMANDWGADMFISIHHNAGGGDGAEIYHTIYGGKGKDLARYIMDQFKNLGQNVRYMGPRESQVSPGHDYYYEIRWTNMMALILEYAFIDTADSKEIDTLEEQQGEAVAIAKGICSYLGQEYKENTPAPAVQYNPPYIVDLIPQGIQVQMFDDHLEFRMKRGLGYTPWKVVNFDQ